MSRYEWERGQIKLPSAEFARVRQAMADVDMKRQQQLFDLSQDFWKGLTAKEKTDAAAYAQGCREFEKKNSHTERIGWGSNALIKSVSDLPDGFRDLVEFRSYDYKTRTHLTKPKRILKEDMPFPTNRTLSFQTAGGDGVLTFDKASHTANWQVDNNNHAVDDARGSDLGKAFFAALRTVKWTRATGGQVGGNNEYNTDPDNHGGGAQYISDGFGPLGADAAPYATEGYTMADGKRVRPEDFPQRVRDRVALDKAVARERKKNLAAIERSKAKAAAKAAAGTTTAAGVNRIAKGVPNKAGEFTFGTKSESTAPPLRN